MNDSSEGNLGFKAKARIVMLCGLTGSGKTTLAHTLEKEQSAICFSVDRWMIELYGHHMSREDFDKKIENIKRLIWEVVEQLVSIGVTVILDYGFWRANERIETARMARSIGGRPIIYFLNVPSATLRERLAIRNKNLPPGTFRITPTMLDEFIKKFEPPLASENIEIIEYDYR